MQFYDRKEELEKLGKYESLAQKNLFFIRVTGRRRIGKTLLIREYLKKTKAQPLYFFVTKKKEKLLLDEYAGIISDQFEEYPGIGFKDFDDFFKFLFALLKRKKIIAVFDEFQNCKYVDESIFSTMQKYIDLNKPESRGLILVIGSINSMMRRIFENANQPLYGRLNGSFLLKHFPIETIKEILQDHGLTGNDDLLFYYTIFEGIPFYYNYLSERGGYQKSKADVIREDILDESSILLDEGKEILLEEFGKDYSTYFSILEAVACGATTMSRVADISGIPINNLSRYIAELVDDHELLERKIPFDARENNKMGRYYINDNFLDFWFRFIFKNKSRIEMLSKERMTNEIMADMPVFMGKKFEKFIIAYLIEKNRGGQMYFDRIGQYWDRGETEIDIIFTNERNKEIHFGECKLSARRFNIDAIETKIKKFLETGRRYKDWKKVLNLYTPEAEHFLLKSIPLQFDR